DRTDVYLLSRMLSRISSCFSQSVLIPRTFFTKKIGSFFDFFRISTASFIDILHHLPGVALWITIILPRVDLLTKIVHNGLQLLAHLEVDRVAPLLLALRRVAVVIQQDLPALLRVLHRAAQVAKVIDVQRREPGLVHRPLAKLLHDLSAVHSSSSSSRSPCRAASRAMSASVTLPSPPRPSSLRTP